MRFFRDSWRSSDQLYPVGAEIWTPGVTTIDTVGATLIDAGLPRGGYSPGRPVAVFISENPQDSGISCDSLFLSGSFPGRHFTGIYPSETPQERLNVSEG
jgi:hypothetical protein